MFNASIIGSLGRDPEKKTTNFGDVLEFSIAKNFSKDEPAQWITVSVWGRQAESLADRLKARDTVFVSGRIKGVESYRKRNGDIATSIKMTANDVIVTKSANADGPSQRQDQPRQDQPRQQQPQQRPQEKKSFGTWGQSNDDKIPF